MYKAFIMMENRPGMLRARTLNMEFPGYSESDVGVKGIFDPLLAITDFAVNHSGFILFDDVCGK